MKNFTFILVLMPLAMISQNKLFIYSCDSLKIGIHDKNLYEEVGGFDVFSPKLDMKKIETPNGHYYVSKQLVKAVKRSIRKNKCTNVKVCELDTASDLGIDVPAIRHK